MTNESIRNKYTPRQYFNKLVREGYEADYASSVVNGIFGGAA